MAEVIRVDYEALAKIADRFGQQSEAVADMLTAVRGAMEPLESGGWVGRGSDAFFAEMNGEILPAVQRLTDALAQAGAVSRQIGEVMQGAESEACSPFRAGDSSGAAGQTVGAAAGNVSGGAAGTGYGSGAAGAGYSGGAPGGVYGGGAPGGATGGNMYVPQDWLNNVGGFALGGGGAVNDWGIPQNWLDGVAGAMGVGSGGNNYGIPQDWLSGVTDALGGSGVSDSSMAAGGAAGGTGGVGSAGGASGAAAEAPDMPSGGSGGGKEAAASDISSPYGRQEARTGSSALFGGGKAVAEAQNGRLSYQSLGGAGFAPAAGGASSAIASGGAAGAVSAGAEKAGGSAGIGLAIAALTPLVGIMGKAVKDALGKD